MDNVVNCISTMSSWAALCVFLIVTDEEIKKFLEILD